MSDGNGKIAKAQSLSDYFDCSYVINLPERKDRRKAIVDELARANMPVRRGKVEIFSALRPKDRLGFSSANVRGCFLSHYSILVDARDKKLSNVLIMEDDLMILPALQQNLDMIFSTLQTADWGIVYLGHIEPVAPSDTAQLTPHYQPLLCAHFYAVNGPVIPRLVEYLALVQQRPEGHPLGGPQDVDGAINMFRQANPDVLTLIAQPNMGKQRPSRSNIRCPWYERLPIVKQAADLARVVRSHLRA